MHRASFAILFAALACEPDSQAIPVTVQWMDWPAEVAAGTPFRTRLVVFGVCAVNPIFRPGASADESAVTFAPYFLGEQGNIACAGLSTAELLLVTAIDTAGVAPGLMADFARTYEMRATTAVYAPSMGGAASPVRTFGDVTVKPPSPVELPARRSAAGYVRLETDSLGCPRIRPLGLYSRGAALVLENPVDTAALSGSFVRGYIKGVDPQVCGEWTVFHLVSRN